MLQGGGLRGGRGPPPPPGGLPPGGCCRIFLLICGDSNVPSAASRRAQGQAAAPACRPLHRRAHSKATAAALMPQNARLRVVQANEPGNTRRRRAQVCGGPGVLDASCRRSFANLIKDLLAIRHFLVTTACTPAECLSHVSDLTQLHAVVPPSRHPFGCRQRQVPTAESVHSSSAILHAQSALLR